MASLRRTLSLVLLALSSLPGTDAFAGSIVIESRGDRDLRSVRTLAEHALGVFERDFGPLRDPIRIVYRAPGCLRVGYDFEKRIVQLCAIEHVRDSGLASPDVLRHELFHAMLCAAKPALCTTEMMKSTEAKALHEGLADTFARRFAQDERFGEEFYLDRPYVRRYRTDLCASLVAGLHEKGNAIANAFVVRPASFARIARALPGPEDFRFEPLWRALGREPTPCFAKDTEVAPTIEYASANYPKSKLNRFKIDPAVPLDLRFTPNAAARRRYKRLSVHWLAEDGRPSVHLAITADAQDPLRFSIRPLGSEIVKVHAEFRSGRKVVGRQAFYLTDAPPVAKP